MHIISRPEIYAFINRFPLSSTSLNDWYHKSKKAEWNNLHEIKATFNSCDYIGNDRFVFNIHGNNYRLVAMIHFKRKRIYIRKILTHAEYDECNKKGTLQSL
jgi:mRNA interferase HigB